MMSGKKKQILTIPCELPALNQVLDAGKAHWSRYAKLKKEYSTLVSILAKIQLRPVQERVRIGFRWYCRDRRKDPDNICSAKKFIIDGLVVAGILQDDGWKQVSSFSDDFEIDAVNPRIEVIISEIRNHKEHAC